MSSLYRWFWYNTQFWIKQPEDRRPYTYLFRDLYHSTPLPTIVGLAIVFFMIGRYTTLASIWWLLGLILALVAGIVLGHIWWGKTHQEGQQEHPTYLGEGDG